MSTRKDNRAYVFDLIALYSYQRCFDKEPDLGQPSHCWWENSVEFNSQARRWYSLFDWIKEGWGVAFDIHDARFSPLYRLAEAVSIALQINGHSYLKAFRAKSYSKEDARVIRDAFLTEKPRDEKLVGALNLFIEEAGLYPLATINEDRLVNIGLGGDLFLIFCLQEVRKWIESPYELYSCGICFGLIPPAKRSPQYCSNRCRLTAHRFKEEIESGQLSIEKINELAVTGKLASQQLKIIFAHKK